MGNDTFPFVEIPEHFKEIIGVPDPGTRLYRAYGSEADAIRWFDTVFDICGEGGSVSPGGAAGYARVSRPGVHQKLKAGGLTGFLYYVESTSIFGKKKLSANANFYCCIPVSECRAWARELAQKREKAESQVELKDEIDKEVMGNGNFQDMYLNDIPKPVRDKFKKEQRKK